MRYKGLVAGLILLIVACGHKAPPLPPEHLVPEGVVRVEPFVSRDGVALLVYLSDRYANSSRRIGSVYLKVYRCDSECDHCNPIYTYRGKPGELVVEDTPLEADRCYRIEGETDRGASLPRYVFVLLMSSYPHSLKAEPVEVGEGHISFGLYGCSQMFAVYKKEAGGFYPEYPRVERCTKIWTDREIMEGKTYCYTFRNIRFSKGIYYLSDPSFEYCVKPVDVVPPPVPSGLSGVYHAGNVYLFWDPVKAKDLAGYNIYMREGKAWVRVNRGLLTTPAFSISLKGKTPPFVFAVTSVDKKGNESKKSTPVLIRR